MKWLRWVSGRQESGYQKMLLATGKLPIPFDLYLLRYPAGSAIDWHRDEVPSGRHFRLNIVLKRAIGGGHFVTADPPLYQTPRVALFRPDRNEHRVTPIRAGTRYVLSLGWLRSS